MKTNSRISKFALLLGMAAIVLTLTFAWMWAHRREADILNVASPKPAEAASLPIDAPADSTPTNQPIARTDGELPPVIPISLKGVFIEAENKVWDTEAAWKRYPRGVKNFGEIEFHLEGVVQLLGEGSAAADQKYRQRVLVPITITNLNDGKSEVIERGANIGSAHLLVAARYAGKNGVKIADVVWRYADGTTKRSALTYGVQLRDWRRMPYEEPVYLPDPHSKVVWRKANPSEARRSYRLYRVSLANPDPRKTIRQMEFVSTMANPSLVLFSLTLDPLKPGERPDDSPNLEETDPPLDGRLQLLVQTTDGQPIVGANVRAQCYLRDETNKTFNFTKTYTTGAGGLADVGYMSSQLEKLEVSASFENYAGRKMIWDRKAGDVVPASFTLKLGLGLKIGGVVVDANTNGIADAVVKMYRFWRGDDEQPKNRGEEVDFSGKTARTDGQGHWEMIGLPKELVGNIGGEVAHPDYVAGYINLDSDTLKPLTEGTHQTILTQGLVVRGRVIDEQDKPIEGAKVAIAKKYYRERQEATTDADGRFTFKNAKEGETPVSVLAKGRKPASKDIVVKLGMEEVIFKLEAGSVIRGIVQNEANEPLSGVRIVLEGHGGPTFEKYGEYDFSTTSDASGKFEWDGAPDEAVPFYFGKTGYEQKRNHSLKPDFDNVVLMRKARKIEGWVLDATTEQPVTKFRVGIGNYSGPDSFYPGYPGMKSFADANGKFSLEVDEESDTGIKGEADDYAEKIEPLPAPQNGVVQVILKLKPSAALRGVFVTTEGTPLAGASVALTTSSMGGMGVHLQRGKFTNYGRQNKIVTTDSSGQFVLPSPPESAMVVGVAESGFASASVQEVRDTGRLVLQALGRIEGTFRVGGQPVAGQEFMFSMLNAGVSFDFGSYKGTTDSDGKFVIDKVPAGEGQIIRMIKTSNNSWLHSHNTAVTVQPGQTTHVALGDSGAVLKGHVSFETPPAEGEALTISGSMSTAFPKMPKFNSPEESRAYMASDEWKGLMKQMKHFGVVVGTDGSLQLDSVPAGTYTLNISAGKESSTPWENPPVAQGNIQIVVPENPSPYTPITLDEIILRPPPKAQSPVKK